MKILFPFLALAFATAHATWGAEYDERLGNLSTRAQAGSGSNIMVAGFAVQEGAPKRILIRAVGARLAAAPFNIPGTLSDPQLQLFNRDGVLVLANDNWRAEDAATMTSVGAFALVNGSRDAALVATLSPGTYTAHVAGANNGTGVALLELYDVSGSARLLNLSTRAVVGSGPTTFTSGLSVSPSGGARRVLIRAVGPGLAAYGVTGALADPSLAVLDNAGRQIAGGANDNWESAGAEALATAFTAAGAFPFVPGSRDAALLIDLSPGNYTIQANGVAGATGVALMEVYDLTPETLSTVSVTASVAAVDAGGSQPGVFTFSRVGAVTSALAVRYTLSGSAEPVQDYETLGGVVIIPAGATSAKVELIPRVNPSNLNNRTAVLSLSPHSSYGVGVNDRASVTLFAHSGSLYISNLRAAPDAVISTAYGTATVLLSPDETSAYVNVSFSNLSSPEVVAHLAVDGNYVFNLPPGQVTNAWWNFSAVGAYSSADLIAALKAGRVKVSIDTAIYPAGELTGEFVRSTGSAAFNPPAAPPVLDLSTLTAPDAARFLTQATFGPTQDDIAALMAKGYNAWLAEQAQLPPSLHRDATMEDFAANRTDRGQGTRDEITLAYPYPGGAHRQAAWWKTVVTAPDQLRQRIAFALSELLVISDLNGTIGQWQEGTAHYYDIFVRGSFGNFRDLLEQVSRSPMMGIYLSSLRSAKATNGATPDENYARELMQLFTIGLNELNPDGTLRLDSNGQPIPSYTQDTIVQTAKVFTGWSFHNGGANAAADANLFRRSVGDYLNPMMLWPAFHDDSQKTIVGGRVLPAAQGGPKDLEDTLDALFQHANTAPFIARHLIQRLVTSNPSPGYIHRVASAFANNGAGVRGDLGAVVRAVLTDFEARSAAVASTATFGRLKEPLLRATAMFRAFDARSNSGRFNIPNAEGNLAQAALRAPTVFNFFEPNFVLPGPVAAAGLFAPEFQILTDSTAISQSNFYYTYVSFVRSPTDLAQQTPALVFDRFLPLASQPAELVGAMNLLLAAGSMRDAAVVAIVAAINALPAGTPAAERVRLAAYLTITAPAAAVQK